MDRYLRLTAPLLALLAVFRPGTGACMADQRHPVRAAALPLVQLHDGRYTAGGRPVTLSGCNIGCWLLFEPWMQQWKYKDQYSVDRILIRRFGRKKERRLMHAYRLNFIRNRDFKLIRRFDFNLVRVPFNYQLIEHTRPPYTLRRNPLRWLERAVDLAKKNHIYVVLDMHAAPGRQSIDAPTGRSNRDRLWSSALDQRRTIEIWKLIARKFAGNTTVAGYDLLNEPWGNFSENMTPKLLAFMPRLYKAVRSVDPRHIIFMPSLITGDVTFWGAPASRGWRQTAYTAHYYPGLFDSPPGLLMQSLFIHRQLPAVDRFLKKVHAGFFVGEFNVVSDQNGGPAMMRRDFDTFARYGWAAAMWSYKLIKPQGGATDNSWYMVSNRDSFRAISIRHDSYAHLMAYFTAMGTMPLAVNHPLLHALTSPTPPVLHLPRLPPMPAAHAVRKK